MNAQTHVTLRPSLPPHIREHLLDCPRDTWSGYPLFDGKAAFFLRYHDSLRRRSRQLMAVLEDLLNKSGPHIAATDLAEMTAIGKNLVQSAEHHHEMEDRYYFPVLAQGYPQLRAGIEVLDNDHRVVSTRLHELDRALSIRSQSRVEYSQLALAYERADGVAHVLRRHLFDEEEVIIPMFLGVS